MLYKKCSNVVQNFTRGTINHLEQYNNRFHWKNPLFPETKSNKNSLSVYCLSALLIYFNATAKAHRVSVDWLSKFPPSRDNTIAHFHHARTMNTRTRRRLLCSSTRMNSPQPPNWQVSVVARIASTAHTQPRCGVLSLGWLFVRFGLGLRKIQTPSSDCGFLFGSRRRKWCGACGGVTRNDDDCGDKWAKNTLCCPLMLVAAKGLSATSLCSAALGSERALR